MNYILRVTFVSSGKAMHTSRTRDIDMERNMVSNMTRELVALDLFPSTSNLLPKGKHPDGARYTLVTVTPYFTLVTPWLTLVTTYVTLMTPYMTQGTPFMTLVTPYMTLVTLYLTLHDNPFCGMLINYFTPAGTFVAYQSSPWQFCRHAGQISDQICLKPRYFVS
jgi:hypothetical protein